MLPTLAISFDHSEVSDSSRNILLVRIAKESKYNPPDQVVGVHYIDISLYQDPGFYCKSHQIVLCIALKFPKQAINIFVGAEAPATASQPFHPTLLDTVW